MTRLFPLLLLVALAGCASSRPVGRQAPDTYDNHSQASFVARGSVEAVRDSLVAGLRTQDCLDIRYGRDATGTVALSLADPCPGQSNRAVVRLVDGGDGTVRGTAESVYSGASTTRNLTVLPAAALYRTAVPVFVVPVVERDQMACSTVEAWRAGLDAPPATLPATPSDVEVVETPPEIVGGMSGFVRTIDYPAAAREEGAQGLTYIRVVIDETGGVTCAEATVSLRPDLDAAALHAARGARFTPATQNGRPVEMRMTIPIQFRLW